MKLKPVISPLTPIRLVAALIDPALDAWYKQEIVRGCLHVQEIHVAGHYIQWPDFMVQDPSGRLGMEVSFSKLSARFDRSALDFHKARLLIEAKFRETIAANLRRGLHMEIFVGSQTNKPIEGPDGKLDTLHELEYAVVEGDAKPNEKLDAPAGSYSLKPLQELGLCGWISEDVVRGSRFSSNPLF